MARLDGKDRGLYENPAGSGVWWVLWYDHRGKRHRKKIGKKTAARAYYSEMKAKVDKVKRHPDLEEKEFGKPQKSITLAELIATYIPELQRQKSWKDQKRYAEKWTKLLGKTPIDKITRVHGKKRQGALLDKGMKPASANRDLTFAKGILSRAVDDGLLEKNPFAGLKMLPENNVFDRYLLEAEEMRLAGVMSPEHFELVVFAIETGCRRGEQFKLAWTQVNFEDGGWITIRIAKGDKSRSIPLRKRAYQILLRRYQERRSPWVFANSTNGNPIDADNFCERVWRPALKAAQITDLRWNHLRHTLASRLAIRGESLQIIGRVLGHSNTKTSERYAHLHPDSVRAAMDALDGDQGGHGGHLRAVR